MSLRIGPGRLSGKVFVAAVVLGACLAVPVASQSPSQQASQPPTFKAEVEYVEVDALVIDERGAIVRDLRKEDFQIFEDGKSQSILGFTFVDVPIETEKKGTEVSSLMCGAMNGLSPGECLSLFSTIYTPRLCGRRA